MGRQSSINRLPNEVRDSLNAWLRDPAITQQDATERTNALLDELGIEQRVSKSAVNRYDLQMREVGAKLRESRQVAQAWIAQMGAAPQGQVGHLVNELLRTMAFDLTMWIHQGELDEKQAPRALKMVKDLSLSMQRLEAAASENVKREDEIRRQERERAAEAAEKIAKQGGLSTGSVDEIRRAILGVRG